MTREQQNERNKFCINLRAPNWTVCITVFRAARNLHEATLSSLKHTTGDPEHMVGNGQTSWAH